MNLAKGGYSYLEKHDFPVFTTAQQLTEVGIMVHAYLMYDFPTQRGT